VTDPLPLLATLIAHRSDLASGGEPALSAVLARELALRGAEELVLERVPRLHGPPAAFVAARYGTPRLLVNAHLDTVPVNAGWETEPLSARLDGDRVHGLGACDTKGAIAAILAALDQAKPKDTLILFSGDEEHGNIAMHGFLNHRAADGLTHAVVCEPTSLRVGIRHRGMLAFQIRVESEGGHSSRADLVRSPVATLARIGTALDDFARARRKVGPVGFEGLCLNLARIEGGVAFNVIPSEATLSVSLRPAPGADVALLKAELAAVVKKAVPDAQLEYQLDNPPFATSNLLAFQPLLAERIESPVDLAYWTEAAMLSRAGIDAVVFGPGDIARAHAPNEWVSAAELVKARDVFVKLFRATHDEGWREALDGAR
jgi:acetylornithine deacetylase